MNNTTINLEKFVAAWEKLLEEHPNNFLLYFMPDLFIEELPNDVSVLPHNMEYWYKEEELQKDGKRAHHQVYTKNNRGEKVTIYMRIQFVPQPNLPRMMFDYYGRTFCEYDNSHPTLFVFHAYDNVPERNDVFEIYSEFSPDPEKPKLHFSFGSSKIADYSKEELLNSENPFAFAVLGSQFLKDSTNDPHLRKQYKEKLTILLEQKSYSASQKKSLGAILDLF